MPKLTQAVQDQRKHQISEAALRAFSRKGISATSMADIIEETGRSAGAMYSHFESKNQIMCFAAKELMRVRGEVLLRAVESRGEPVDPQQVLRLIVSEVIPPEFGGVLLSLLTESAADPALGRVFDDSLAEWKSAVMDLLAAWGRVIVPAGRLASTPVPDLVGRAADAILVTAHGILMRRTLVPDADIETLINDSLVGWEASAARREAGAGAREAR